MKKGKQQIEKELEIWHSTHYCLRARIPAALEEIHLFKYYIEVFITKHEENDEDLKNHCVTRKKLNFGSLISGLDVRYVGRIFYPNELEIIENELIKFHYTNS